MAEIKNPDAYFSAMVRNSYKDEFRANDNFFKHISSVGDEADIQQESTQGEKQSEPDSYFIERQLSESNIQNWLLFMENEQLYMALSSLSLLDLELLFILVVRGCSHREAAQIYNVTHTTIGKKYRRILHSIKNFLKS